MDVEQKRIDLLLENALRRDIQRRVEFIREPFKFKPVLFRPCRVKMLVVLDGFGFFGSVNFGLEEFLSSFDVSDHPSVSFSVTKAHFNNDQDADLVDFRFENHNLSQYDVIWLFGVAGGQEQVLSESGLRSLTEFMDDGGGVFATGDHADLGVSLCGGVPRVRSMRKWYWPSQGPNGEPVAPAGSGTDRHDTVVDHSRGGAVEFDDQSDDIPQKIRVKYYATPGSSFFSKRYPHPVLCGPNGVIDVLPDHAHEGECYVPDDLNHTFNFDGQEFVEYPTADTGGKIKPEIIAWSNNQSGISEKGTVSPKIFGAIGVLDGHRANVGRVLVDATWHHFFNINLRGELGNPDPVQSMGFYASSAGLVALERIKTYYRNTAVWLARKKTHRCIHWGGWWILRWDDRIAMELRELNRPLNKITAKELVRLGKIARDVYGKSASQCGKILIITDFLVPDLKRELLWPVIGPGPLLPGFTDKEINKLQSDAVSQEIAEISLDSITGSILYHIAQEFPDERSKELAEKIEDPTELFQEAISIGLSSAVKLQRGMLDNSLEILDKMEKFAE